MPAFTFVCEWGCTSDCSVLGFCSMEKDAVCTSLLLWPTWEFYLTFRMYFFNLCSLLFTGVEPLFSISVAVGGAARACLWVPPCHSPCSRQHQSFWAACQHRFKLWGFIQVQNFLKTRKKFLSSCVRWDHIKCLSNFIYSFVLYT